MLKANNTQALHRSVMLRFLITVLDDNFLSKNLLFKGGTCASMLGYLDRFSIDLDFDVKEKNHINLIRQKLEKVFTELDLVVKDSSKNVIQYFLGYKAPEGSRNTLKIDAIDTPYKNNVYESVILPDINHFAMCQTKETLFTNKLVALVDRFEKGGSIAGRDLYDIHHFITKGFTYNEELIKERRNTDSKAYLKYLISFIEKNINQTIIDQDLNFLLDNTKFHSIRKTLKLETIGLLNNLIR